MQGYADKAMVTCAKELSCNTTTGLKTPALPNGPNCYGRHGLAMVSKKCLHQGRLLQATHTLASFYIYRYMWGTNRIALFPWALLHATTLMANNK